MVTSIIKVFFLSMLPVGELRASLPLALAHYRLPLPVAYGVAVLGNIVPAVVIVLSLGAVERFLSSKSDVFRRFFERLFEKTNRKHSKRFQLFKAFALVTFTAIPLPFTGAWTASLAAFVFAIPPRKAIPLIALGVAIAGVIVALITYGAEILF